MFCYKTISNDEDLLRIISGPHGIFIRALTIAIIVNTNLRIVLYGLLKGHTVVHVIKCIMTFLQVVLLNSLIIVSVTIPTDRLDQCVNAIVVLSFVETILLYNRLVLYYECRKGIAEQAVVEQNNGV